MNESIYDIAIIGGGINGTAIAADAALRGLSVILFEKDDLASKTSSQSTKLIHGGLRYLEYGNFAMVKKSLKERAILSSLAPHLISPCPFVLPHEPSMRPFWLLKVGLMLYDNLYRSVHVPQSKSIQRGSDEIYFSPLKDAFSKGILYYDCLTDDARLTVAKALQAQQHGATIATHAELISAEVQNKTWSLRIKSKDKGMEAFKARCLINAAGPWVNKINDTLSIKNQLQLSLVKGSHLIVPKLYEGSQAYLLQSQDKRIVFVIPYHGFSLIGTTDLLLSGQAEADNLSISEDEITYLLQLAGLYFSQDLSRKDLIWSFSGARPLVASDKKKPQAISRDYVYQLNLEPCLSLCVYSGKLTTHRQLAEDVVDALRPFFPSIKASISHQSPLPGATLGDMSFEAYAQLAFQKYAWLDEALLQRYLKTYGTETDRMLENCKDHQDLGHDFGATLFQREVDYLCQNEWARTSEDILFRRTKLGLCFPKDGLEGLDIYLHQPKSSAP